MLAIEQACPYTFPSDLLLKRWKHPKRQIEFLSRVIQIGHPEYVHLHKMNNLTSMTFDFNASLSFETLTPPAARFFACLEILTLLVELSEGDNYLTVLQTFQPAIAQFPDILSIALA